MGVLTFYPDILLTFYETFQRRSQSSCQSELTFLQGYDSRSGKLVSSLNLFSV